MPTANDIFGRDDALIGMVHVPALPGTPRSAGSMEAIVRQSVADGRALADAGYDAIIIENMHDVPYLRREVGPEIVAAMSVVTSAVRDAVSVPLGVQVLAGANRHALAIAHACGANFIRAEGFVFANIADEGLLDEADAGRLLRYRRSIGADDVHILVDVKKKHGSHAITADVDIAATARAAEFFGADGVIVTGTETGAAVATDDLTSVRQAVEIPVIVGSGVTPDSVKPLLTHADALIVGSWTKVDGVWSNAIDATRARAVIDAR